MPLYETRVQSHLQYCMWHWSPYLSKDIAELGGVHRKSTRMIKDTERLSYDQRLKRWGLFTIKRRLVRGDMIKVYKILNGLEKINRELLFCLLQITRTREHSMKCKGREFKANKRKYFSTSAAPLVVAMAETVV